MRGVAIVIALAALVAGTARADDALDAARKDVDSSDYLAARTALSTALTAGAASPDDLAEIYKLTGIVEGALGDTDAAKSAFERWLALDPRGSLPDGTSPKITRPFDAAARFVAGGGLKVKADTTAEPPTVTLVLVDDPLHLVARARVFVRADGGAERQLDATGIEPIALPRGRRLDLRVQGLDRYGNRVVELGSADVPIVITGAGPPSTGGTAPRSTATAAQPPTLEPPRPIAPRRLVFRWWLWGGAAVVVAGAATYLGARAVSDKNQLDVIDARSSEHMFGDATTVETRIRRELLAFDIGIGVGGALAIGAAILYATERHAERRVAVVPAPGGGAVVVGGHF